MRGHWREFTIMSAAMAAMLAVFFFPAVFKNVLIYSGDFSGSDLLELNIPRRALAAEAVANGELPLWEARLGSGLPLLAEGQAGIFYPTTLPLYLSCSLTSATNYSLLLTLWIAMAGSYWLARSYGVSPMCAVFAALAYGLGGSFVFRLKHLNMVQVIAWLPCSLALLRLFWLSFKPRYWLLLVLVWACQFLAGHPHVTYICWLACGLYALALFAEPRHEALSRLALDPAAHNAGGEAPRCEGRRMAHMLAMMILGVLFALLLSAVQLLPTWELVHSSNRAAAKTWETLQQYPFKLEHILRLAAPYSSGSPADGTYKENIYTEGVFWESTPYIGLIPLGLALLGLFVLQRRSVWLIAGLALLFLWTALGPQGGLFWLFWKFCPAFHLFRFPARLLIPFQCFAALLAALGAQATASWLEQRYGKSLTRGVMLGLLVFTFADLYRISSQYQEYLPSDWEKPPAVCSLMGAEFQRVYSPTYMTSWSQTAQSGWKGAQSRLLYHLSVLAPDLAAVWGVNCHSDHVALEGGVELAPYFCLQVCEAYCVAKGMGRDGTLSLPVSMLRWLKAQGVSHILSFVPLCDIDDELIADTRVINNSDYPEQPLYVYAVREPLPMWRLVSCAGVTEKAPQLIEEIEARQGAAGGQSLYEIQPGCGQAPGTLKEIQNKRLEAMLEVSCPERCYLTLAANYDGNWRVFDEQGRELPLLRFNHAYQAVLLEPGEHRLTWQYHSLAFSWGWKLSLIALVLWLTLAVWQSRKLGD
ncbi:hypothetical protein IJT17_01450 [bacterium]|nr:hypothetical protein [bacterium]